MAAVWMRARAELRGRWGSSLVIVALIGLAGGVAMTAAAGARRTDTAFPRFLEETRSEDFLLSATKTRAEALYADIAGLPEVERSGVVDGLPLVYSPRPGRFLPNVTVDASDDGNAGYTVHRLHMLSGRPPRPDRPLEVAASLSFADTFHVDAGDRVTVYQVDTDTYQIAHDAAPLSLLITGVEVGFTDVLAVAPLDASPQLFASPAMAHRFPRSELNYDGILVKLLPGADPQAFLSAVRHLDEEHPEAGGLFLEPERDRHARVQHAIHPEAVALWIFALLAAIAGVLAVGQILSRRTFLDAADTPTLRSLGMSGRQLSGIAGIRGVLLSTAGGVVAVGVAVLASPLMPIGPARIAEPHRGFETNWTILGAGFGTLVVLLTAIAATAGWRAAGAEGTAFGTAQVSGAERPSRIAANAGRTGLAPSVVSGLRFALEPGRGRTAVPVRTAMTGVVAALAAIMASLTFGTNLSRVTSTPALYGKTWDVDLDTGFGAMPREKIVRVFGGNGGVESYSGGVYGSVVINGHQISAIGIDALKGSVFPTLVRGRPPADEHEIALGGKTLETIGASVGDTVRVRSGGSRRRMRIVGQTVFPELGQGSFNTSGLGEGAATVASALSQPFVPDGTYSFVLARFVLGADGETVLRELRRSVRESKLCPRDQECGFRTTQLPAELKTYADIKTVPLVLAVLLILMGAALTAHTLVTSVQRRRRDLATLKTLGFVRRQVLATVAAQASVLATIGLLVGLPLGIAAGRWAWTLFADQLGVPASVALPVAAIALAVPAAVLLANLVAALPARSAARTEPAVVLRSE